MGVSKKSRWRGHCAHILIGCGRFFEGSAEEMNTALNKTLASLPDDTVVYVSFPSSTLLLQTNRRQPGHEYTKANVKFAISVLQSEPVKKLEAFADQHKETQGNFTMGDEKVSGLSRDRLDLLTRLSCTTCL